MIYILLIKEFFILGLFSIGGAYSALPIVKDIMDNTGWMDDIMLSNIIAITESTPGSFIVNLSSYIGAVKGGILGLILTTLSAILPAFIVMIIFYKFLSYNKNSQIIQDIFLSLRPVVCALILVSGLILLFENVNIKSVNILSNKNLIIFFILLIIYTLYKKIKSKKLSSILFILISAFTGIIINLL